MRTKGLKVAFLAVVLVIGILSLSAAAADDVKATNYPFITKGTESGGINTSSPLNLPVQSITGTGDESEILVSGEDNVKAPSSSWIKPMPVQFIRNAGQAGEGVQFEIVSESGSIFFTDQKTVFVLSQPDVPGGGTIVFSHQFVGASSAPVVEGIKPLFGKVNFFIGNNRNNWITNVDTYQGITYHDLYPGIDLTYEGTNGDLKSEFVIGSQGDPANIRMRYDGVTGIAKGNDGSLIVSTRSGSFTELAPDAYQVISGRKVPVIINYKLFSVNEVGFDVAGYDLSLIHI